LTRGYRYRDLVNAKDYGCLNHERQKRRGDKSNVTKGRNMDPDRGTSSNWCYCFIASLNNSGRTIAIGNATLIRKTMGAIVIVRSVGMVPLFENNGAV